MVKILKQNEHKEDSMLSIKIPQVSIEYLKKKLLMEMPEHELQELQTTAANNHLQDPVAAQFPSQQLGVAPVQGQASGQTADPGIECPDVQIQNAEQNTDTKQQNGGLNKMLNQYRLNQNYFTKDTLVSQKNFVLLQGKNYIYFGGVSDGLKHGYGVLIANNSQTIYEGSFRLGMKMGKGYLKFSSGSVYVGDFVNSRPHGYGTFSYPNSEQYTGQFQNGAMHGNGMWISNKGDKYIGEWRSNKADGHGIHIWVNGDKYEGEFKDFLKHGYGVEKFNNGDMYRGDYEAGKPNGYGEYFWSNGSVFKGDFKAGLRHGRGVWKRQASGDSDVYEGDYQNDKKSGKGIFKWASGNIYEGDFFDDLRHGEGEMKWVDGTEYRGKWQKGLQNGRGSIKLPGMEERHGLFENNVMVSEYSSANPPYSLNVTRPKELLSRSVHNSGSTHFRIKSTTAFIDQDLNVIPETRKTMPRKSSRSKRPKKDDDSKMSSIELVPELRRAGEHLYRIKMLVPETQSKKVYKRKNKSSRKKQPMD